MAGTNQYYGFKNNTPQKYIQYYSNLLKYIPT